jgi:hypothetical protein
MSDRPRGDITTVPDLVSRDSQDGYLFPLDTTNSWFRREDITTHPTATSVQEFAHRGTAEWGGRMTFEIGSLTAGDMLQGLVLQIRLGHWYPFSVIDKLASGEWSVSDVSNAWTYANGLGISLIEYAEFEVGDQTIERITGEFIQTFSSLFAFQNMLFGFVVDGAGLGSARDIATNTHAFSPNRPWPTQNGTYYCFLPFFFTRTRLKESFPLLSCTEGSVRIHVKLRPFAQMVRSCSGIRQTCTETPLGQETTFIDASQNVYTATSASIVPVFDDFRVLTFTALCTGNMRSTYLRKPVEMAAKFVQNFMFDEPFRYIVSKPNSNLDTVDISLPLELNHPVQDIIWIFRRRGVEINNDWLNFTPALETQYADGRFFQPWLSYASLRVNGMIVEQAEGDWWRWDLAKKRRGGITAWNRGIYGYSFARYPDNHQPSGTANMSRSASAVLNLTVNVPEAVAVPPGFDPIVGQGWEVQVYVIYYNWLRFENGLCQKLFAD